MREILDAGCSLQREITGNFLHDCSCDVQLGIDRLHRGQNDVD